MKALVLISAMIFSVYAQANESVNFTYFGNEGRNRIFLSCNYAESSVDQLLHEMGATDIDVRCTGGIDFGFYTPVRISAKFNLPAATELIEIRSDYRSNCYFDVSFINHLIKKNSKLEKVNGTSHCFSSDSRYSFKIQLN